MVGRALPIGPLASRWQRGRSFRVEGGSAQVPPRLHLLRTLRSNDERLARLRVADALPRLGMKAPVLAEPNADATQSSNVPYRTSC